MFEQMLKQMLPGVDFDKLKTDALKLAEVVATFDSRLMRVEAMIADAAKDASITREMIMILGQQHPQIIAIAEREYANAAGQLAAKIAAAGNAPGVGQSFNNFGIGDAGNGNAN